MDLAVDLAGDHLAGDLALDLVPYRRRFVRPLRTGHGVWAVREGAIARLSDGRGRTGFGEIAPLPDFGTESLEMAIAFLDTWNGRADAAAIAAITAHFPATRFALDMAIAPWVDGALARDVAAHWENLEPCLTPSAVAGLLPAGADAIAALPGLWAAGHRVLKWKVGTAAIATELAVFERLLERLPAGGRLRLDANGALDLAAARSWLGACDRSGDRVELFEQPLPPGQEAAMGRLSDAFRTAIALDESVASVDSLATQLGQGWTGPVVLKPAIAGSPRQLLAIAERHRLDAIVSSCFETPIGLAAIAAIADRLGGNRARGFGTAAWLEPLPAPWWQTLAGAKDE